MKGAIIANGYYESAAYTHQISRIAEAFAARGEELDVIKNNAAYGAEAIAYDYAVFLDKDTTLARYLEQQGVVLFNNSFAIENCDDKIKTAISLSKYPDVFMPKSLFAPLQYHGGEKDEDYFNAIEEQMGYPVVIKEAVSSLGQGVYLAHDRAELEAIEKKLSNVAHMYQIYVEESRGRSVRAFVIGHKVAASMLLTNETDFRSNVAPSVAEAVEIDEAYTVAAEKISEYLELDYCAVDFFVGAPLVIEINSNAYFEKIEKATGVDIAGEYADYILGFMKEIKA
ncbi:MAG: RimK family alpha-L-glutamate ligase [Clostridia bacterium]|nr:RimK family alpha-L-glutamate ligase [Clostridia bacterium]